jgi:hypothetical protein
MSKSRIAPLFRASLRLVIGALALATGVSHSPTLSSAAPASPGSGNFAVPPNAVPPQFGCDGGDGGDGDGGDYCQYVYDCTYFCGCGDNGDCYYGFGGGDCWWW